MSSKWEPFKPFRWSSLLPDTVRQRLREVLLFKVASGCDQPQSNPSAEQKYREPSPSSQPKDVHVPSYPNKESVYNIQYYTRDTRRNLAKEFAVEMHPSIPIKKIVELPEGAPKGSPGNKNPAVLGYDPTGTRSAMSTTHAAMNQLLQRQVETNPHNVHYEWEPFQEEIIRDFEEKNLPPIPGRPCQWHVPTSSRQEDW
ncbi:unnamed protein product [Albugo candida]|uniref:NADH dehydrogenase [ubiquinone] 1 alpha subcomplex subunit 7 n=1 Tax=Albugo candida TaxID=65357 RepID=A0A024FXX7_9STRA|nr:unnamed protein product [Albugo candida]|eukprot:CCI39414.1 unnamed protein product [Albugo candida]